jgi:hypothetical protein
MGRRKQPSIPDQLLAGADPKTAFYSPINMPDTSGRYVVVSAQEAQPSRVREYPGRLVSIINLDPAFELGLFSLARRHRPHQLVLHQPGGALLHAQSAAELDRGDPALALRQVVHRGTRW